MMKRTIACGLVALSASLFGACDDGSTTGSATSEFQSLASAVCGLSFGCCDEGEAAWYWGPFTLESECEERLLEAAELLPPSAAVDLGELAGLREGVVMFPNLAAIRRGLDSGRIELDQEAFKACESYFVEDGCNQPPTEEERLEGCIPREPAVDDNPCAIDKLLVGKLKQGETCTSPGSSLECAPGFTCGTDPALGVEGRCVPLQNEGDTCIFDSDCEGELYCSLLDGRCAAPRAAGEVCVFADRNDPLASDSTLLVRCQEHLSCDPISNTCVEDCQRGAVCTSDEQCDEDQGLSCILEAAEVGGVVIGATGRCSTPRSLGQPCTSSSNCEEGLRCDDDPRNPGQKSCQEGFPLGADCLADSDCAAGFCDLSVCTAPVAVGQPCPTGRNAECDGGQCVQEAPETSCSTTADCPLSGECGFFGDCGTYCADQKEDGAACDSDSECLSDNCIADFCRTPPLALGVACETASDCESDFCNWEDDRVCAEGPLPNGDPCMNGSECVSEVCFEGECTDGLAEGEECGGLSDKPCDPRTTFCDVEEEDPPICVALLETGDECERASQCRSQSCTTRWRRQLCAPPAGSRLPRDTAVCDGNGGQPIGGEMSMPEEG